MEPVILHIDLGSYPISNWLRNNKYVIFSELLRFSKILIEQNLDTIQAIMISNYQDNIVFILKKENLENVLEKAFNFFMDIEEYEKCAEIRDLNILIENLKNESKDIKNNKSNKRQSKVD